MANNSTFIPAIQANILQYMVPIIFIGLFVGSLNIISVIMILRSRSLNRPSSYPIVSVLLGAAFQGFLMVPMYSYKRLTKHHPRWICDCYRLPYFLCEHTLKISLMVNSFDRLMAIKYPYRYQRTVTKKLMSIVLFTIWIVVLIVDLIPFIPFGIKTDEDGCKYIPPTMWALAVIVLFNILPFIIIVTNYLMIWVIAVKMTQKVSLKLGRFTKRVKKRSSRQQVEQYSLENSNSTRLKMYQTTEQNGVTKLSIPSSDDSGCNNQGSYNSSSINIQHDDGVVKRKERIQHKEKDNKLKRALEMKATKTSVLLVAVYILCWGPIGIMYLIDNYCLHCISIDKQLELDRFVVKLISFLSSVFIPLVYCWKTKEFRNEIFRYTCKKRYRKMLSGDMLS